MTSDEQPHRQIRWPNKALFRIAAGPAPEVDTGCLDGRNLFVGIGAMRSGTTWLSSYLKDHPDFYHSPIKEMNFFNTTFPNRMRSFGEPFRRKRIEKIVLESGYAYPTPTQYETLRDLVEVGSLSGNVDSYKKYFARRIDQEPIFGEISPVYALLPPKGFRIMAATGFDLRILYLMRDPAKRAASHINFICDREGTDNIKDAIDELAPASRVYERSNYGRTIDALKRGAPNARTLLVFYEHLFRPETIETICEFLGIRIHPAKFDNVTNSTKSSRVGDADLSKIRQKLAPVYQDMEERFGSDLPDSWNREN